MTKHAGHNQKAIDADHGLDPSQFRALNARFYNGFNLDLITARLGVLCLQHESPELIETHLLSGVSWGKLRLTIDPEDDYQTALARIAELELVSLRQHAAEILFRLFWVHAHEEPCPWLALARLRRPSQLKDAADTYLSQELWSTDDQRTSLHRRACWGRSELLPGGRVDETGLEASVDTVAQWIAIAAEAVREAPLYNAYKHGLTVLSSEPFTMKFGGSDEDPSEIAMEAAAGYAYLEPVYDEQDHRRRWQLTREPVDFDCTAAEAAVFSTIIRSIVAAGALDRGVPSSPSGIPVLGAELTPEKVRSCYSEGKGGIIITRLREGLRYFEAGPADPGTAGSVHP